MTVCFFGTYNANYSRNSSLRMGLIKNGVTVREVHFEIPNLVLETSSDLTITKSVYRILRKLKAYLYLISKSKVVFSCQYIFVLHPGHLDLPLAWLLSKLGGKKLFFDDSISPYDTMFIGRSIALRKSIVAGLIKNIEKILLLLPDKIIVDTNLMKKFVTDEFGVDKNKVFVVPLGANNLIYHPEPANSGRQISVNSGKNGKVKVFFFGLYNPMHGANYIMEAIKLLKNEKNLDFTLLGKGYLKEVLENYARKNHLGNVRFTGFVPEEELVRRINDSDIVLGVFSNSALFHRVIPNKIFAALATRKPLITARLKVMEEFLKHKENVYFCQPENPQDLASAIKAVSTDTPLRLKLAENGYKLYKRLFTPEVIGRTVIFHL